MKRILSILCLAFLIVMMTSPNLGEAAGEFELGDPVIYGIEMGEYYGEMYGNIDADNESEDAEDAESRLKSIKTDLISKYREFLRAEYYSDLDVGELLTAILKYDNDKGESGSYKNTLEQSVELSFTDKYEEVIEKEETDSPAELGEEQGKKAGELAGEIAGRNDAEDDKTSQWEKSILSDEEISDRYNLDREVVDYSFAFFKYYKEAFKEKYQETYSKVNYEKSSGGSSETDTDLEERAKDKGEEAGNFDGERAGRDDAEDGDDSDWEDAMKSENDIEDLYNLDREPEEYRDAFLEAYKDAFKEKYQETYSDVNFEKSTDDIKDEDTEIEKRAKEKGKMAGDVDGKAAGREDAEANDDSDWEDAIESDSDIEDLYNLDRETDEYQEAFLEAYKEAFEVSYRTNYSDINFDNSSGAQKDNTKESIKTEALKSGAMFGENDGFREAVKDYHSGEENDVNGAFPRESEIIKKFMLDSQSYEYRLYFIKSYKESFVVGYEKGFRDSNMDPRETAYNNGFAFGSDMGSKDGIVAGSNDYFSHTSNDWLRAIESEDYLKTRYELYKEIDEYQQGFLNGYKTSFRMSYVEEYTKSKSDLYDEKTKRAYDVGSEVGKQNGLYMGQNDYTNDRANNWKMAIETDAEIMQKYNLSKESVAYINAFISSYKENFMKGYSEAYQKASAEVLVQNVEFVELNGFGGQVVYESPDNFKEVCTLEVPAGSILRKTSFALEKREYLPYYFDNKYVPLTNIYNVTIRNGKNSLNLQKPLTLSFKYYGPMDAGIYRYDDGKWNFVKSQVYRSEEDEGFVISTKITDKEYFGAQYVVLVDEEYTQIDDIDGHWAEDEIDTFIRRKYVSGYPDHTFKPDYKVTRAEFVKILDNASVLTKNETSYQGSANIFKDAITFGVFENSIMKAYYVGLINGYPDGTFRPNMHISYQEVEWIMKKMPGLEGFKWQNIAKKMQDDEGVASNSTRGMNQKINRAEVIYMLNDILNKEIGE